MNLLLILGFFLSLGHGTRNADEPPCRSYPFIVRGQRYKLSNGSLTVWSAAWDPPTADRYVHFASPPDPKRRNAQQREEQELTATDADVHQSDVEPIPPCSAHDMGKFHGVWVWDEQQGVHKFKPRGCRLVRLSVLQARRCLAHKSVLLLGGAYTKLSQGMAVWSAYVQRCAWGL